MIFTKKKNNVRLVEMERAVLGTLIMVERHSETLKNRVCIIMRDKLTNRIAVRRISASTYCESKRKETPKMIQLKMRRRRTADKSFVIKIRVLERVLVYKKSAVLFCSS